MNVPPAWVDLLASLRSCALPPPGARLQDCVLLSPGFTGSSTMRNTLGPRHVFLPKDRHAATLSSVRAHRHNLTCFISTLRDPVERLESGVRYRQRNETYRQSFDRSPDAPLASADALVEAYMNVSHPLHRRAPTVAWPSRRLQSDYLLGHRCNETRVHVLCTSSLTDDLHVLLKAYNETSLAVREVLDRPPSELAHLRDPVARGWIRHVAAPLDNYLHRSLCSPRHGTHGPERARGTLRDEHARPAESQQQSRVPVRARGGI